MDAVFKYLDSLEWVRWEGRKWWANGIWLKDPEQARDLVSREVGFWIGKQRFKSLLDQYFRGFVEGHPPKFRENFAVLYPTPSYLFPSSYYRRDLEEGLWYPVWDLASFEYSLYFMPIDGDLEILTQEHWPDGVYCLREWRTGRKKSLDPSGTMEDLFEYWSVLAQDVEEGWELSLALMLPALFRQGRIGFIIVGSDAYAQDHLMYRIFRLVDWNVILVAAKSAYKQVRSLWGQSFIYITHLNGHMARDPESSRLVKLAMEGNTMAVRRPRTDLTVDKFTLYAPVFICSAGIKIHERLATRLLRIHLRNTPLPPYFHDKYPLQPKALMGAFRLFQRASHVVPPDNLGKYTPYVDWAYWAYRYAKVLGVEDRLLAYLQKSNEELV